MPIVVRPIPLPSEPLLALGRVVATPGAADALRDRPQYATRLLARHAAGDWGAVCDQDRRTNDAAVHDGGRVLSAYPIDPTHPCQGYGPNTLWIITE